MPVTNLPKLQPSLLQQLPYEVQEWIRQLQNIASAGAGTVTSVSVATANGVSGSVATPTVTPAITLSLGAITPSSVAASGTVGGSNLSGTNTGDVNDATITTTDVTTNNVSTTKHGWAPKAPNDATKYLDGTGAYTTPAGSGGTVLNDQIIIQDQQTSGTTGHAYTSGAWRTVILNTTVTDTGSNVVSLGSNQFALKTGSYEFDADVNGGNGSNAAAVVGRLRLRNITDTSTVVQGTNRTDAAGVSVALDDASLSLSGSVVIAAQKTFELQLWVTVTTAAGHALTTGDVEIYASIRLRKYA